ncbi:MAG: nucleoside recognition protein [Deltaproteobacteria bacterium]|nr:nucleoside recognition protein [Deltaproteobacteria bacterium]
MANKPKKSKRRAILISLIVSLAILAWGLATVEGMSFEVLTRQLLLPLCRLLAIIALGLAVGEIIEASGWTRRLGVIARPAFRFARLGDHCGATFSAAFFSGTAANTMLAGFFQDGKICKKQLFLTNLLNHFPAYFLHLPTTLFIVIPLTGKAGGLYFLLTFSALLLRCSGILVFGHIFLPKNPESDPDSAARPFQAAEKQPKAAFLARIRDKLPNRMIGIAVYVIPVYSAVFVLNTLGLFNLARDWLAAFITHSFIPVESLSVVVISFAAEFTSGFAAAGALMDAGVLTVKQTALALLVGNIVAFPMRALRHQLPRYIGIFSPRIGLELLLLGQGLRVVSLILAGVVFWLI